MCPTSPVKIIARATKRVHLSILSHRLSHAIPLHLPRVVPVTRLWPIRYKGVLGSHFQQALTYIGDVQWEPEQECVADQLGKQQAQRELDHALEEGGRPSTPSMTEYKWLFPCRHAVFLQGFNLAQGRTPWQGSKPQEIWSTHSPGCLEGRNTMSTETRANENIY